MLKTSSDGRSGPAALGGFEKKLTGRVPDDSAVPRPMRKAVRLMLGGAAVTVLLCLFAIVLAIVDRNGLTNTGGTRITTTQFANVVIYVVVVCVVVTGLWIAMARLNRAGRMWARYAASALCAVLSYYIYEFFNSLTSGTVISVANIIFLVLVMAMWLLGIIAIALIWRSESTKYYKARAAAR
ncbi:MAG TPA: hypothetical protein VGD91_16850 [Trebonia sp.]